MNIEAKIVDQKKLQTKLKAFAVKNQSIVFTNGCFDILHKGHIHILNESSKLGDILIVGLNSNNSVKRLKGEKRPINDEKDRAILLASLQMVDLVVLFEEDTPLNLIKLINPNFLVKGGDYTKENVVGNDYISKYGGKTVLIDFLTGYSTTNMINNT